MVDKTTKKDSVWKTLADAAAYLLLRLVWAAARILPLGTLRRGLEGVASLIGRFDRRHRRVIRENIARAFPDWSDDRVEACPPRSANCGATSNA